MLAADYMVDLVWETGVVFTDQTVFTAMVRAPATSALRSWLISLATREDLASPRLCHSHDVLQFHEVIEFRLLF
jgi:hypothetical protein